MHFHCPPRFIERPDLLIDALAAHEVVIKFDGSSLQGVGAIDVAPLADCDRYETFRIVVRPNRFRPNLRVEDVDGMPLMDDSPLVEQLVEVLISLGILSVSSPVEEELDFVQKQFGEKAGVATLIAQIWEKHRSVALSVNAQAFEKAARFADKRDALLDQLNELCAT